MLRNILAILLSITTLAASAWLLIPSKPGAWIYIGFDPWQDLAKIALLRILNLLLPGFIIGVLLPSRQIVIGTLVSVLTAGAVSILISLLVLSDLPRLYSFFAIALQAGVGGFIGSVLGIGMRRLLKRTKKKSVAS